MTHHITRFAPSPTGPLHLGHVLSALWVWSQAKHHNAKILLRIEDHDQQRCQKDHLDSIMSDLHWLGLRAAPECYLDEMTPHPDFLQSKRVDVYQEHADKLKSDLYHCQCSRKQILSHQLFASKTGELIYPNTCRNLKLERSPATCLRWQAPPEAEIFHDSWLGEQTQIPSERGDVAIKDRRGNWLYLMAATVDDHLQGVNLIVRGADLLGMTGLQVALRKALGDDRQVTYLHHPLIVDQQGKKLSKRFGSASLAHWRSQGLQKEQIFAKALAISGIQENLKALDLEEALEVLWLAYLERRKQ